MATTTHPWDRLDTETTPAWQAFTVYRDAGLDRSLAKTARALGKSTTLMAQWSKKHSWALRSRAWDSEQERLYAVELRVARKKAAQRNVAVAQSMKNVAAQALVKLSQSQAAMTPSELVRMMEAAVKIEAMGLGSPTDHVQVSAASGSAAASREHVTHLTDEERRTRMLQLRRALDSRLEGDEVAS